jgi:hypothetical protein
MEDPTSSNYFEVQLVVRSIQEPQLVQPIERQLEQCHKLIGELLEQKLAQEPGKMEQELLEVGKKELLEVGKKEPLGRGKKEPLGRGKMEPLGPGKKEPLGRGKMEPLGPGKMEPLDKKEPVQVERDARSCDDELSLAEHHKRVEDDVLAWDSLWILEL